jgi:hypothetical protein
MYIKKLSVLAIRHYGVRSQHVTNVEEKAWLSETCFKQPSIRICSQLSS